MPRTSHNFNPGCATVTTLAEAIGKKWISSAELLDLTFRMVDERNPKINAIVWQSREAAMEGERQADTALADCPRDGGCGPVRYSRAVRSSFRGCWQTLRLQGA